MLMMGQRKKTVATILGPDPREHQESQGEETPSEALHECVSELMDAIKSDDVAGAVEALRSAFAEMKLDHQEE